MDVIKLFKDYGIQFSKNSHHSTEGFIQTRCVFCDDSSDHLGWHVSGEFVNCWKCGGHSIEWALQKLLNMSRGQVDALVKQYEGRGSTAVRNRLNKRKELQVTEIKLPGSILEKQHKRYLEKRGFDSQYIMEKYQLLGTGIGGEWKYRIIIPIYFRGKLMSFQGRDITDRQRLRYKSLDIEKSVMHYKHTLYGIDYCEGNTVVVMEGPFDVWRWGDGAVATYGTTITEWQVRLLSRYRKVFFLFDAEEEAQRLALKAAGKLACMGVGVEVVDLEGECDPAELNESEVRGLKKELGV